MGMFTLARQTVAMVAALGLGTSAIAAPLPAPRAVLPLAVAQPTAHHGGWGRRHDGGGSDVLGGLLILGGIVAIAGIAASSASKHDAERARSAPPPRADAPPPSQRYDDRRDGDRPAAGRGQGEDLLDRAVNACADAAARDGEVDRIDDAHPDAGGFRVEGALQGGRGFTCSTDPEGRVREIRSGPQRARPERYDPEAARGNSDDDARADETYETAWAPVAGTAGPA